MGWIVEKLKTLRSSIPFNPLLAHPMYLAGYIERLGTGTADIVRLTKEVGLPEPRFVQEEDFKTILFRKITGQVDEGISIEIRKIVLVIDGEMKRADIQKILQLSHRENFVNNYIIPALEKGYINMKFPDSPKHPQQRYVLTEKGEALKNQLKADIV